jgi:ribosomal protein S18 acetylase RimI-like enzyme
MALSLRRAEKSDLAALSGFTNSLNYIHRHLDWRDTLEWLGRSPFWLWEDGQQLLGALACPPEPPEAAWVRLFAVSMRASPDRAWRMLFEPALEEIRGLPVRPQIVSLGLREWYVDLLKRNGFVHYQDIVVFMYDGIPPDRFKLSSSIQIRPMVSSDLEKVAEIDHLAFEPIWQLSLDDLRFAKSKSIYCTVAEKNGEIIGYTMSSNSGMYAHLSRLAVHPQAQRQHLGYSLVQELLKHFLHEQNFWGVTLNTQHNNISSLGLYHNLGFRETGERFPVMIYPQ